MLKLSRSVLSNALAIGLVVGIGATALPAPALADGPIRQSEDEARAAYEQDRATILAMAGDFRVTFDMQETTAWMEGYEPIAAKVSGGYESVRVIEDTGDRIVLQHLLVVGDQENPYVVKHWRQDWQYQPTEILTFDGGDSWTMTAVPERMRAGRWSQTVYQVDDSPRYAGWGQWQTTNGVRRWRSNWTTRPLARRDAVRSPIYDRYNAINRHQLTPNGWIHWQDNTKMMPNPDGSGELVPVVQEYVLNTYDRFDNYNVAAADSYWANTKDYWAAIRAKWDAITQANDGVRIAQNPEYGTQIGAELLGLADAINTGEKSSDAATAEALVLIEASASRNGG